MLDGKSWADQVEEEEEQTARDSGREDNASASPAAIDTRSSQADGPIVSTTYRASNERSGGGGYQNDHDMWRRRESQPQYQSSTSRLSRGGGSSDVYGGRSPQVLTHKSGGGRHDSPTHGQGYASARNSQGGSALSLHDTVTAACQEVIQPYIKELTDVMSQLINTLSAQIPRAVAAAVVQHPQHDGQQFDTHSLQRAMFISLAPVSEQLANFQRTLAAAAAAHTSTTVLYPNASPGYGTTTGRGTPPPAPRHRSQSPPMGRPYSNQSPRRHASAGGAAAAVAAVVTSPPVHIKTRMSVPEAPAAHPHVPPPPPPPSHNTFPVPTSYDSTPSAGEVIITATQALATEVLSAGGGGGPGSGSDQDQAATPRSSAGGAQADVDGGVDGPEQSGGSLSRRPAKVKAGFGVYKAPAARRHGDEAPHA